MSDAAERQSTAHTHRAMRCPCVDPEKIILHVERRTGGGLDGGVLKARDFKQVAIGRASRALHALTKQASPYATLYPCECYFVFRGVVVLLLLPERLLRACLLGLAARCSDQPLACCTAVVLLVEIYVRTEALACRAGRPEDGFTAASMAKPGDM
jgi:hypothetical protein